MHVGIIGGGLMGVALAYFLAEAGEQVTILEQSAELGGMNGRLAFADGLSVARYQHAILPNDDITRRLCARLGLEGELTFDAVRIGFVHDNRIYPMTTILDFLAFPPLNLRHRINLGSTLLKARAQRDMALLDRVPVKEWLIQAGGAEVFDRMWRPLLEAKFDGEYAHVPAAYIWAWLNRMLGIRQLPQMKGRVGYLKRGHYSLIDALAQAFVARGGRIETQVRVREIIVADGQFQQVRTHSGLLDFDAVVAAVATPSFGRLVPGAENAYLERLGQEKYLGLICPVMVLDGRLSGYWTLNLTDPNSPFSTIIETPHTECAGCTVVHLPRYTASDNDWMGVSDDDIREAWLGHLKQVFPTFDEARIQHFAVSRSRYVEPVFSIHGREKTAPVQTPYQGLYLANAGQVYPELPTSDAVISHAERVAQMIRSQQAAPSSVLN